MTIAIVGKYVSLPDAYLSVVEALKHAGYANDCDIDIRWVAAQELTEQNVAHYLADVAGILVPGGFGQRGTDGKILAIRYAREQGIPFFGICLGMQLACVEFAQQVAGLTGAHTAEEHPECSAKIIDLLPDQEGQDHLGGTLRLGAYPCVLQPQSLAAQLYRADVIQERHRHRYEVNTMYRDVLAEKGLCFSGVSPDGRLVEIIELPQHPFFIACQFHPEFLSRPTRPHPLFRGFVTASLKRQNA